LVGVDVVEFAADVEDGDAHDVEFCDYH
jgi:hypothetical protein